MLNGNGKRMNNNSGTAGSFACPICGTEEPHGHSEMVINAWRQTQINRNKQIVEARIRAVAKKLAETNPMHEDDIAEFIRRAIRSGDLVLGDQAQ